MGVDDQQSAPGSLPIRRCQELSQNRWILDVNSLPLSHHKTFMNETKGITVGQLGLAFKNFSGLSIG